MRSYKYNSGLSYKNHIKYLQKKVVNLSKKVDSLSYTERSIQKLISKIDSNFQVQQKEKIQEIINYNFESTNLEIKQINDTNDLIADIIVKIDEKFLLQQARNNIVDNQLASFNFRLLQNQNSINNAENRIRRIEKDICNLTLAFDRLRLH